MYKLGMVPHLCDLGTQRLRQKNHKFWGNHGYIVRPWLQTHTHILYIFPQLSKNKEVFELSKKNNLINLEKVYISIK